MVSIRPLISVPPVSVQRFSDCTKSTNYGWYHRHFYVPQFFQFPSKVKIFILLFVFFQFYTVVSRNSKVNNSLFCWLSLGLVVQIRWSVCISESKRSLCVLFSWINSGLSTNHLFVWSNLNFWHDSQWFTLPIQSNLVSYSFTANFLHSLIIWLIVSSLSSHNLHLLFCCVNLFLLWYGWSFCHFLYCY